MAIIGQAAMTRVIVVEADPLIALSGPIVSRRQPGLMPFGCGGTFVVLLESPAFLESGPSGTAVPPRIGLPLREGNGERTSQPSTAFDFVRPFELASNRDADAHD